MKRRASQSRSSGCDGGSPLTPKLSTVGTMPRPRSHPHTRFTSTRCGSADSGRPIQAASSLRPLDPVGMARSTANTSGMPRGTTRPRFFSIPRTRIAVSAASARSSTIIAVSRGGSSAPSRPSSASISAERAAAGVTPSAFGGVSAVSFFSLVRSALSRAVAVSISARREAINAGSGSGRAIQRATLSVSLRRVFVLERIPASAW